MNVLDLCKQKKKGVQLNISALTYFSLIVTERSPPHKRAGNILKSFPSNTNSIFQSTEFCTHNIHIVPYSNDYQLTIANCI